jgi:hypothetical protein
LLTKQRRTEVSLDERDYMRERNRRSFDRERPFAPPKPQNSTLMMISWWLLIAFSLYKGYGWWHEKQQRERSLRQSAAAQARISETREHETKHRSTTSPPQVATATPPRAGPTPYRPPSQAAEEPAPAPAATTGGTIYLCKAYNGGTFWAQAHCNQHKALIDSIVSVPVGLPFQQQVAIAEQKRQAVQQNLHVAPPQLAGPDPALVKKGECQLLDKRIEELDAMARQPQSGSTQDWIRSDRQKARDRQFALRC